MQPPPRSHEVGPGHPRGGGALHPSGTRGRRPAMARRQGRVWWCGAGVSGGWHGGGGMCEGGRLLAAEVGVVVQPHTE